MFGQTKAGGVLAYSHLGQQLHEADKVMVQLYITRVYTAHSLSSVQVTVSPSHLHRANACYDGTQYGVRAGIARPALVVTVEDALRVRSTTRLHSSL